MKTVIEMAREAGIGWGEGIGGMPDFLERFAELVRADEREKQAEAFQQILAAVRNDTRADEREACAKVCEEQEELRGHTPFDCAAAIRARGNK